MTDENEDEQSLNSLNKAIKDGNDKAALLMVESISPKNIFRRAKNGRTPLENAIEHGRGAIAIAIIEKRGVTAEQILRNMPAGDTATPINPEVMDDIANALSNKLNNVADNRINPPPDYERQYLNGLYNNSEELFKKSSRGKKEKEQNIKDLYYMEKMYASDANPQRLLEHSEQKKSPEHQNKQQTHQI